MIAGHQWYRAEAGHKCRDCPATYDGTTGGVCLAPAALARRLTALRDDARALANDLRTARDAAEPGAKAPFRYPLRHLERASALIAAAAIGTGGSK